jgi:thioredoxin 1
MAKEISDSEFNSEVIESDLPVLVDFWAPWCGPCRMLGPIVESLSEELEGKAKVVKVNVDESPETAGKYGITSIPTVMIFKGGEKTETLVGVLPKPKYIESLGV